MSPFHGGMGIPGRVGDSDPGDHVSLSKFRIPVRCPLLSSFFGVWGMDHVCTQMMTKDSFNGHL